MLCVKKKGGAEMNLPKGWKLMILKNDILLLVLNGEVKRAFSMKNKTTEAIVNEINEFVKGK